MPSTLLRSILIVLDFLLGAAQTEHTAFMRRLGLTIIIRPARYAIVTAPLQARLPLTAPQQFLLPRARAAVCASQKNLTQFLGCLL